MMDRNRVVEGKPVSGGDVNVGAAPTSALRAAVGTLLGEPRSGPTLGGPGGGAGGAYAERDEARAEPSGGYYEQLCVLTQDVCSLPAVATLDWCDRAASCVAGLLRPCVSLVMVARVLPQGKVGEVEAVGVDGRGAPDGVIDELRCRSDRTAELGFAPRALGQPSGVEVRALGSEALRAMPGQTWLGLGVSDVLMGVAAMEGHAGASALGAATPPLGGARMLVVQIGLLSGASRPGAEEETALRALLPVLARRASMAIGAARGSRSGWISPREQLVLEALVLGKSVRQIAAELGRSPHTVHDHVKALHRKLGASSRGELIARALGHLSSCVGARRT